MYTFFFPRSRVLGFYQILKRSVTPKVLTAVVLRDRSLNIPISTYLCKETHRNWSSDCCLGSLTHFLSLKIFSLSMGSVDLECPGCCQKRGSAPRNYYLWNTPLETFAKMFGNQLHLIMNWLKFFILFAFCYFIFYGTYFYSFISLLRNDS